ncbi:MAG TPA: STAS domain-containing protein [Allosphingosinicella sp.]|jgi:anti-anti-sigma factor|uniref:STAS domain-containing protein n=1 Tax=Allosphingosinicella sp. TaxID=2823234 RepID=UPI002F296A63
MDWSIEERGGTAIARPRGRIDEASWQDFAACLTACVARAAALPSRKLVVDFSSVEYMSSRGLRALTLGKREAEAAGVTIALASPNEIMREILAISRYDKLFAICDTVEAAL